MQIIRYRFPKGISEDILLKNGCTVVFKDGEEMYPDLIPDEYRGRVKYIDDTITCSITRAKELIREYGGVGWIEHVDRDGCVFETTEIKVNGNNSRNKYNHHL